MTENITVKMPRRKRIGLIAHDAKKKDLIEWCEFNIETLRNFSLVATGTTGTLVEELGLEVTKLHSGVYGGDQQVGALIAGGELDIVIFFLDPLEAMPHDHDVKALLRLCAVWNIPVACNRSTGDFLLTSPLIDTCYNRIVMMPPTIEERKMEIQDGNLE